MIKEVDIYEIPEKGKWGSPVTETSKFCESTLSEFMRSGIKTAEVTGWPGGDPANSKQASSKHSSMKSKINTMKLDGVDCILRGKRIFIMKTIVRKMGDRRD